LGSPLRLPEGGDSRFPARLGSAKFGLGFSRPGLPLIDFDLGQSRIRTYSVHCGFGRVQRGDSRVEIWPGTKPHQGIAPSERSFGVGFSSLDESFLAANRTFDLRPQWAKVFFDILNSSFRYSLRGNGLVQLLPGTLLLPGAPWTVAVPIISPCSTLVFKGTARFRFTPTIGVVIIGASVPATIRTVSSF
jgi:hypothetical protein